MASQEPETEEIEVMFRRGLLHPFGVSFLVIIQKACTRAQGIGGPIGHTSKKIAKFISPAFPFICAMQYEWLLMLAFTDDHIRAVANISQNIFPPSIHLFKKIERVIDIAEALPEKFDESMNINFPLIMHRFPFLDSALATCTVWMNYLLSTFTYRRISYFTKEKEIMVDIINFENFRDENSELVVQMTPDKEVREAKTTGTRGNHREIIEKGKRGRRDSATEQDMFESYYSTTEDAWESEEYATTGSDENIVSSEDPILELFDTSWHMNPAKASPLPTGGSKLKQMKSGNEEKEDNAANKALEGTTVNNQIKAVNAHARGEGVSWNVGDQKDHKHEDYPRVHGNMQLLKVDTADMDNMADLSEYNWCSDVYFD